MPHILQLLLFLALVTLISKAAGSLSVRLGQPAVFGEIVAGLALGPTLLDILGWSLFAAPAGPAAHVPLREVVHDVAEIGVILLMFVAGMETDLQEMRRVGKVAFWAALGGVLLPLWSGGALAHLYGYGWGEGMFIGAVLTATSVSISAQTLMELGALRSREGSAIVGAAVIDDVMGIIVLSLVVAFASGQAQTAPPRALLYISLWIGLKIILFFGISWFLGRRYLERLTARAARLRISEPLLAFVVVVAFLYAWAAESLGGVAAITGSYIAGVLFAQTSFKERIDRGIHPLTYSFFVPVFFINIGLRANLHALGGRIGLILIVLLAAVIGKVVGCGVGARLAGFSSREAYRVGVGMISRGEVGLIVAGYGLTHAIIDGELFSVMVLMVLVTTMITPVWLRFAFPRGAAAAPSGAAPAPAAAVYESVAHVETGPEPEERR